MAGPTFVNATDLAEWANRLDSQSTLPRVIRRLIHATSTYITRISFPADEGVQLGGWDGRVSATRSNAFVPAGDSVWEIGTNKDIKGKADDDYTKRTQNPLGMDPKQTVFVFVTPRRWSGKDKWISERREEGDWLDVRVYDADDLEAWLELAPAVHAWLSTLLGKHPHGVEDLSASWTAWAEATQPVLTPELVLAGREKECESVRQWLSESPSPLAIAADSSQEAIVFFAAVLYQMPTDTRVSFLARAIVVSDPASWQALTEMNSSLIVIPTFVVGGLAAKATNNGHHVLTALGPDAATPDSVLQIPRVRRQPALDALKAMGLPESRAQEVATLARRSLTVLRRRLAVMPDIQRPQWASPVEAQCLLPAVLAGTWNDANQRDREIMESLSGVPYHQFVSLMIRWANEPDPPVRRIGNTWMVVSRIDAWELTAKFLTSDHLDKFETVVLDVLQEIDPRYDLPPGQRWLAQFQGTGLSVSGLLRSGLADTVALMAVHGDACPDASLSGQGRADRIVRNLLDKTQGDWRDWRLWASLSQLLKPLAEAAPDVFLEAVETGSSGDDPVLLKLFTADDNAMFESSPHIHLLWVLEVLAWSSDYLGRTALALARLARLDPTPHSNHRNRPAESLREIFLSWRPHTSASAAQRMDAIDLLRNREPEAAWHLMIHILPSRTVSSQTGQPAWRDWVPDPLRSIPISELWEITGVVVERLIKDAGYSSQRWCDLLGTMSRNTLPPEQRKAVIQGLWDSDTSSYSAADITIMRDRIRQIVSHHGSFPDAKWALPADEVALLRQLSERFEPDDIELQHAWLFSQNPLDKIDIPMDNWEERQKALEEKRLAAVQEIYSCGGIDKLLHMSDHVEQPFYVWSSVGKIGLSEREEEMLLSGDGITQDSNIVRGFVDGRFRLQGWEWSESRIRSDFWRGLSPKKQALFLACLPFESRVWDWVDELGADTEREYWSLAVPCYASPEDAERATRMLMKHGRPLAAVNMIDTYRTKDEPSVPVSLIVDVLEQVVTGPCEEDLFNAHSAHCISVLLDVLEASGQVETSKMAVFEWAFAIALEHYRKPRLLHCELSNDPDFFVQLLCLAYKAENEPDRAYSEEEITRGKLASQVLESWRTVPGTLHDGDIDGDLLRAWVASARERARAEGRGKLADQHIGHIFAFSRCAPDGTWPDVPIRDIIEELHSKNVERGLEIQVYNNRGIVSKSIDEGGRQERELANKYSDYASAVSGRWPRTAAVLRAIAADYSAEAKKEDQNNELREDLEW